MLYIITIKRKSFTVHRIHIMICKGKDKNMNLKPSNLKLKPLNVKRDFFRYCVSPIRYRNSEFKLRIRAYIICHQYADKKVYLISKTKSYDSDPIFFDSFESLESYISSKGWFL